MAETYNNSAEQLGFDTLLADTEAQNRQHRLERETAHLPGTMSEAIPFYAALLAAHDIAMRKADVENVCRLRTEARLLARKLNGNGPGILAGPDAPGNVLSAQTAAPEGEIPIWGQTGCFTVVIEGIEVRVEMDGVLGIASHSHWLGFAIHAINWDRSFLSETGYRSFLGVHAQPMEGLRVDTFVGMILNLYLIRELGGRMLEIGAQYRDRDKDQER